MWSPWREVPPTWRAWCWYSVGAQWVDECMTEWMNPILRAQLSTSKWKWQWTHQICEIKWCNDYIALTTIIGMWQAIHSWDLYHSMFLAWIQPQMNENYLCWWESTICIRLMNRRAKAKTILENKHKIKCTPRSSVLSPRYLRKMSRILSWK